MMVRKIQGILVILCILVAGLQASGQCTHTIYADQAGYAIDGSAPMTVCFEAQDWADSPFCQWELSTDPEFESVYDSYRQPDFEYTFRRHGIYYVRFVADDADGSAIFASDTFQITIAESSLRCPNAFSPTSSPGINDEWRVRYKSIVEFECRIYNRHGQHIATLTSPDQGWDGKYKGHYVPAGAYYYTINALGSDGKQYHLTGDINIIKTDN